MTFLVKFDWDFGILVTFYKLRCVLPIINCSEFSSLTIGRTHPTARLRLWKIMRISKMIFRIWGRIKYRYATKIGANDSFSISITLPRNVLYFICSESRWNIAMWLTHKKLFVIWYLFLLFELYWNLRGIICTSMTSNRLCHVFWELNTWSCFAFCKFVVGLNLRNCSSWFVTDGNGMTHTVWIIYLHLEERLSTSTVYFVFAGAPYFLYAGLS